MNFIVKIKAKLELAKGMLKRELVVWFGLLVQQDIFTCGNFSDTSHFKFQKLKGSIGHGFPVCIRTENQNQVSFYPFVLHEISVLIELTLGHLCYSLNRCAAPAKLPT